MGHPGRALVALAMLVALAAGACSPGGATTEDRRASADELGYVEIVSGGANARDALPMIVAIHGLGDTPEHFADVVRALDARARIIVPRAPTPYAGGFAWFPFRVRDRDVPRLSQGLRRAADRVAALIAALSRRRPTIGRPIVTGFSQGGMITFELAVHHPSVVGAAFPVSGWLPPPLWPRAREAGVRYPAIRAMHGDADDLIPIGPTRDAVARLRSLGFAVELHEQRGVGHEITAAMEHELHGWLRAEAGRR